jgi:hypothetical protein
VKGGEGEHEGEGEHDAVSTQKLGPTPAFTTALPQECLGQPTVYLQLFSWADLQ